MSKIRLHATCVSIGDAGVLLTGSPGSGKSDLALRLIDRGAMLVADDQVLIARRGDHVYAQAPETIRGRMEVRGIGVLAMPHAAQAELRLEIDLEGVVVRMPEPRYAAHEGILIPYLALAGREASAAAKIWLAVSMLNGPLQEGVTFPFPPQ